MGDTCWEGQPLQLDRNKEDWGSSNKIVDLEEELEHRPALSQLLRLHQLSTRGGAAADEDAGIHLILWHLKRSRCVADLIHLMVTLGWAVLAEQQKLVSLDLAAEVVDAYNQMAAVDHKDRHNCRH